MSFVRYIPYAGDHGQKDGAKGRARPGYAGTRAMQAVVHQGEQDEYDVTHSE